MPSSPSSRSSRSPSSPFANSSRQSRSSNPMLAIAFGVAVVLLVGLNSLSRQDRRGRTTRRTVVIGRGLADSVSVPSSARPASLLGRLPAQTSASRPPSKDSCQAFLSKMTTYFGPEMAKSTACPREARWFEAFRKVDPSPNKNFVNIGCNKGADAAAFLHRWDPHFEDVDWNKHAPEVFSKHAKGACGQTKATEVKTHVQSSGSCPASSPKWGCSCQDISDVFGVSGTAGKFQKQPHGPMAVRVNLPSDVRAFWEKHECSTTPSYATSLTVKPKVPTSPNNARPVAYCVELMPQTFEALMKIRTLLPAGDRDRMVVDNFAVGSGYPLKLAVPNVAPGTENSGIGTVNRQKVPMVEVTQVSLDSYTESKNLTNIDFVLIDTEGNDPMVILGGAHTLQRTRFVAFENHGGGAWASVSLKAVIDLLDTMGFDCFWTANDGTLWEVTGCYPFIDAKVWSNVGCAKRGDILLDTMRSLADANGGLPQ